MLEIVKVGIADLNIVKAPQLIRTSGLGSCVGVVLYDEEKKVAGLVHVMLPDSALAKANMLNPAKFADTGIQELLVQLAKNGARRSKLKAKIAGGAQMFQFESGRDLIRIGSRNIEAVKQELRSLEINLIAEDIGGNNGRTIEFNPDDSSLMIRTVNKSIKYI
ncbi:chemotaxis protein CheD [Cytobacillus purgationiresistens]|uniref:Probable chemoreceptor glutamine deamidase CheD n=1 Tax=Cytobacillus purgationiresistens TaxID=863449 RepID=A0ABU0AG15_9BACI|nr:chemotaxis protein CheD [Cytobacillus purgationiresistens]MDQ0270205.1 chemotaxis protein CheD [Cytobacillus purgationiresistens]